MPAAIPRRSEVLSRDQLGFVIRGSKYHQIPLSPLLVQHERRMAFKELGNSPCTATGIKTELGVTPDGAAIAVERPMYAFEGMTHMNHGSSAIGQLDLLIPLKLEVAWISAVKQQPDKDNDAGERNTPPSAQGPEKRSFSDARVFHRRLSIGDFHLETPSIMGQFPFGSLSDCHAAIFFAPKSIRADEKMAVIATAIHHQGKPA